MGINFAKVVFVSHLPARAERVLSVAELNINLLA